MELRASRSAALGRGTGARARRSGSIVARALLLLCAWLAGLLLVLVLRGSSSTRTALLPAPAAEPAPCSAVGPLAGASTPAAPAASGAVAGAPARLSLASAAETAGSPRPAPPGRFTLLVVARDTQLPVASATLLYLELDALDPSVARALEASGESVEARLLRLGRSETTDAHGQAFLPLPVRQLLVSAESGELWNFLELGPGSPEPARLELLRARPLQVRVLDVRGALRLDVPVALYALGGKSVHVLWQSAEPDAAGLFQVPHAAAWLARQTDRRLALGPLAPFSPLPRVELWAEPWPEHPLSLTLPDTSALRVRFFQATGEPYAGAGTLQVALHASALRGDERGGAPAELRLPIRSGLCELGALPPGSKLTLRARIDGLETSQRTLETPPAGPAGEYAYSLGPALPLVRGRVLDAAGQALAGVELSIACAGGEHLDQRYARRRVQSDPSGLFSIHLPFPAEPGQRRELWIEQDTPGRAGCRARVPLAVALPAGEIDLGEVRLEPAPLLLAGRVSDEQGRPVAGALVRLWQRVSPQRKWSEVRAAAALTRVDGGFEIGAQADGLLAVTARKGGFLESTRLPASAGVLDLAIALQRAGGLSGSLRLPQGFPPESLRLKLEGSDARGAAQRFTPALRQDGHFELLDCPSGRYTLNIAVGREPACRRIAGIEVEQGRHTRDPRLTEIDLCAELRVIRFECADAEGQAPSNCRALVLDGAEPGRERSFDLKGGVAAVPTSRASLCVQLYARGLRAREYAGVRDGERLELEPPPRVLLRLSWPSGPAPAGKGLKGQHLWASIAAAPVADADLGGLSAGSIAALCAQLAPRFGKIGTSEELRLPWPGRYRVQLHFGRPGDAKRSQVVGSAQEIEVLDRSARQTLPLAWDSAAWERALAHALAR